MSIPPETYALIDERQAKQRQRRKRSRLKSALNAQSNPLQLASGSPTQKAGSCIELQAQHYLESNGLRSLARNLRIGRLEIDLLMAHGPLLVVVEVRSRSRSSHGSAADSIDRRKRQKLARAIRCWQLQHHDQRSVRFDVVLQDGPQAELQWIPGAFDCEGS